MAKNPMRTPKITTTKTIKMNKPTNGSQPIKNEQSGTKELSFEVLKNAILKHRASSQYIQASIIILRDIFEDDTIQGANFAKQPHSNESKYIETIKQVMSLCDNQNPTHEDIWRVCYSTLQPPPKK